MITTSHSFVNFVSFVLISMIFEPSDLAIQDKPAAGLTDDEVPIAIIKSAPEIILLAFSQIFLGIGSPNITESYLMTPSHNLQFDGFSVIGGVKVSLL